MSYVGRFDHEPITEGPEQEVEEEFEEDDYEDDEE